MVRYRLNRILLILLFSSFCFFAQAQEVLTSVKLERVNPTQYRVRYQLNGSSDYELNAATLVIYRKRGTVVEEIFSEPVSDVSLNTSKSYTYNWKTDTATVKAGDLLQAKVILLYNKPAVVKTSQKPATNIPPTANAGSFIDIELPVTKPVILNGSGSSDNDGKIASVEWKQIAGPSSLAIAKPGQAVTEVKGDFKEGRYAFELKVADEWGETAIDRMIVTVRPASPTPKPVVNTIAKKDTTTVNPANATASNNTKPFVTTPIKTDSTTSLNKPTVQNNTTQKPAAVVTRPVTKASMPALKGGPSNAFLNILVPGLGHYKVSGDQYGNDRKISSFLVTAFYTGALGGSAYYYMKSNDQYDKYIELSKFREYQHDANGNVIGVRGANQAVAKQQLKDAKTSRRNALILAGVGGGILVTDLVYTFIKGSKNKKQWEREANAKAKLFFSSDGTSLAAGFRVNLSL
jgi:hypothetical protein